MPYAAAAGGPLVLSIDVGSSSVRAAAYQADGSPAPDSAARAPSRFDTTPDGGVEIDAIVLRDRTAAAVNGALRRLGRRASAIRAVGTSVFASSVLGLDARGEPLTPVFTYADTRNAPDAARLRREWDAPAAYDRTGTPIHASYLPARMRWLRRTRPQEFRAAARWVTFGEYLFEQLFGRPCGLGLSLAAWSGMLNRRELDWDAATLQALELAPASLGVIDPEGAPVQGLARPWRARWPALARVPWCLPLGDGFCSNLGTAGPGAGAIVVNVGTSAAVRALVPGPAPAVPPGLWEYRVDRARSLLGGAESNGGIVAVWLRQVLQGLDAGGLDHAVADLPADGHGLTVLPFLAGERSPGWDDAARATIHGLRLDTRPPELLLAGLEAVAFRLAAIYDLLAPEIGPRPRVHVSGGALRSMRWTSILADALGRPVVRSQVDEPTSRGAALWAWQTIAGANTAAWTANGGRRVDPDPQRQQIYQAARQRQARLYKRLSGAAGLESPQETWA